MGVLEQCGVRLQPSRSKALTVPSIFLSIIYQSVMLLADEGIKNDYQKTLVLSRNINKNVTF